MEMEECSRKEAEERGRRLMRTERDGGRKLEEKEAKRRRGGGEEHVGCRTLKTAPSKQVMRISLENWIRTAESYCCYYFGEKTKYDVLLAGICEKCRRLFQTASIKLERAPLQSVRRASSSLVEGFPGWTHQVIDETTTSR